MTAAALNELNNSRVLLISDEAAAHYLGMKYDPEMKRVYNFVKTNTLDGPRLELYTGLIFSGVNFLLWKIEEPSGKSTLEAILRAAKNTFDYVILDVDQVFDSSSDVINVDTLPQCDFALETYFDELREMNKYQTNKEIQIIGQYNEELKYYQLKQIRKMYKQKQIFGIPFSEGIHRAATNRTLKNHLKLIFSTKRDNDENQLYSQLQSICTAIEKLELDDLKAS